MNPIEHEPDENRLTQTFESGKVWADYSRQGDILAVLHVEAAPALRGTGAAGTFMQGLADFARAEGLRLKPICGYAAVWLRRHRDTHDLLA